MYWSIRSWLYRKMGKGKRNPAGRGMGRRHGGRGGFCSRRGCAPHFLFETSKRKCAAPGGKEKMFERAPVQWPSALTGVGVLVQAPIWPCLRARYNLLPDRYCRPVADGADGVGAVIAWNCVSFRCRSSGSCGSNYRTAGKFSSRE